MPKIVDHDQRRADLLDALWRVVASRGAAAVTVRSVAAEAGVSKSNVGHYFRSRAELLSAAVAQQLDDVQHRFDAIVAGPLDADAAIDAILLAVPATPRRREQSRVWLLLLADSAADPDVQPILSQLNRAVRAAAETLLTAMAANGLVGVGRDAAVEAARLHALVDGLSVQSLSDPDLLPARQLREVVQAQVLDLGTPTTATAAASSAQRSRNGRG